ncbi:inositol hexakisphosphate and diphosphoinositol-pentakisphosphate kinase 2-like [Pollicipes pollicipes]|uniref:inositol hexakisphosphate and diphosphoinositol-pentakisphosphate kinase 2-like n=1 Tax=Pollicipes pollicipes TaxID=41117 RepID=UPI001884CAA2|nr:inositol hexakisphosphate and diphosphoinositol-pentakisphosphate kinase 2-like [Pollicipes pollicipes]
MRGRADSPAWDGGSRHPLAVGYMDMVRLFCALCKDNHVLGYQHGDGDHWTDWTSIYRRADSIPDEFDDEGKQVVVGICAMEKKSGSRPMKEILTRLEEFEYIKCLIFPEHVILKEPVENWPLCDCLISFHSKGFPLEKAIQYSQLRKPFIINNLNMQYALQDRRKVYRLLEREGIDLPRFAILDRDAPDFVEERDFMESDDVVEVGTVTFNKPFVEKPVSAEDHNIYIYYPSSAGGGSQRLFRKIGSRSSVYSPESRLRRTGSYIYENFMPTDGTDVKADSIPDEFDDEGKQVVVGICAMEKKSGSRPMKEILTRLEEFEYIKCLIFPEHVILKEPVENWPLCDCLISFHSKGFPLEKAIQYSQLRKPFIINNLNMQYALQDRRKVYRLLEREGIDLPRFAILDRDAPDFVEERDFMESDDVVEVGTVTFNKPFVEKPVSAEDHNIYIYYPSSAGGGSQRLFRKIGSRSSVYSPESRLRRTGSYIYENFMPTDGTDVKVYTVGPEYAHAEARKSPALDGKVERDQDGKEVRYPVILTNTEKLIARKVCQAFKQTVCGFDLLRANGRSYVCDVNGFSFVKNSNKYYDDSAKILGNMILRELAPTLHIPWSVPFQLDDPPIVPTTFGKMMELRCAIAVIRHGDRTPKQKMKMEIRHQKFFDIFRKYDGDQQGHIKLKKPKQLQEILDVARELLDSYDDDPEVVKKRAKLEQLRNVLEMYGHFSGINRKIQIKYQPKGWKRSSEDESTSEEPSLVLVLKWGGELTPAGRVQAEELGKIFRCMYPGGQGIMQPWGSGMSEGFPAYHWEYAGTQGLGLLRLHSTYRHDLKIYASDEGRVQMTAAAFAKGLLALEGELTPILVQMVKSADTNGLLDNDSDSRNLLNMVKNSIHDLFQQDRDFTAADIQQLNPTGSISVAKALSRLKNPVETCQLVYNHLQKLLKVITPKMEESKELILYHGETWELMLRRWVKLEKDFKTSNGKFDISKIPDIYDNIKYDLQHNQKVLQFDDAEEMYRVAKTVADVIVPQEYGLTRQEKLSIGHGICTPLLKKIQADLRRNVDEGAEENVNRLNPIRLGSTCFLCHRYGHFSGINRKIQIKYQPKGWKRSSEDESSSEEPSLVLVLKWGGELTPAGRVQAEELGKIFRCMYPGGQGIMQPWGSGMSEGFPAYHWEYAGTQGLGLLRLHSTYRHDLKIYASDEGRVQMTAAAFAKGLLALEGELTPILVQMVKSADTNGLLDNDSDSRNLLNMVKNSIHDLFQQDRDFTAADIQQLNPTGSISVAKALSRLKNPVETCQLVYNHLQKLLKVITPKMEESKELILYHGETWELMLRRWVKLEKDFKTSNGKFDISKIPDIYDNIKYDLQHNQKVLQFDDAEEMYRVAKTVADVIVPQEYGLTRQEKLSIGHGICTPLLKKIQADLRRNVDEGAEENVNRLNPMYSRGVSSPQRHVRTRLYFTSESHLHSLLTMLRYGGLADEARDEQWRRAMDYASAVSELNYMSQVVIMLYEDPTKDPLSENRFHVELHFSPGVNCCVQKNPPQGPGFRPQSRGDMNKLTNPPGRRPPSMIEEEDGETIESGSEPEAAVEVQAGPCSNQRPPPSQPIAISRCATSPSHLSPPQQDLFRSCSHPGSPDRRAGAEERPRSLEGLVERGRVEPAPARPDGFNSGELDDEDEELRRQRHSVPSQTAYAQQLSILNQQLQLGAPGGSGSSLFSTAVISGSSSAPELKSLFTPVTAIGIEGCGGVPSIRPLETLHNAMSLRQVNAFIDRVTSMEFRTPTEPSAPRGHPPPLALHSPTQSLSISGPSSFVSSPGSSTPLDGGRIANDGW